MLKNIWTLALLLSLQLAFANQDPLLMLKIDSIRVAYHIPALSVAVVSSSTHYLQFNSGYINNQSKIPITLNDRYRIGSNTKAITCFLAAQLVHEGKISWRTKFFDLYPELKVSSNKAFHKLTLLQLLSFRAKLYPYTYTDSIPTKEQFSGDENQQRYQFVGWFLKQAVVHSHSRVHFSNVSYIAAQLMLEKVTNTSYKELVTKLGDSTDIHFEFGSPNEKDRTKIWGHDKNLIPEAPADNYKHNWLLAAGNINMSLADEIKFIQLQLAGLKGESTLLTQKEFAFLFHALPIYSLGWFAAKDSKGQAYYYNIGNPGTFLSEVYVYPQKDLAFILLCNVQSKESEEGLNAIYSLFKQDYIYQPPHVHPRCAFDFAK